MSKYINPIKAVSIQFEELSLLTIHCDGQVTTSDRLKPEETAALVLDHIKTTWLKDAQATKIRELQDRIKRLEKAGDAMAEWLEDMRNLGADACLSHAWREAKEAKP